MGYPRPFTIIIAGRSADLSGTVATLLSKERLNPEFIAISYGTFITRNLVAEGLKCGIHINDPMAVKWVDPKRVDLWLAVDDFGEKISKRLIRENGPAPHSYYRSIYPEPVVRCEIKFPDMESFTNLCDWIHDIEKRIAPWNTKFSNDYLGSW